MISKRCLTGSSRSSAVRRMCDAEVIDLRLDTRLASSRTPTSSTPGSPPALWPHSTLGWPEDTPELRKWYPPACCYRPRHHHALGGPDGDDGDVQHGRARHEARGHEGTKTGGTERPELAAPSPGTPGAVDEGTRRSQQPHPTLSRRTEDANQRQRQLGIPFYHVAINPTILDGKGERMTKSKGNGVDPVDIIDTYGADALRFTLTTMATETQDARMPVKKDAQGRNTSEKFDLGRNFCNKLWNAWRFALILNRGGRRRGGTKARRHEGKRRDRGKRDEGTKGVGSASADGMSAFSQSAVSTLSQSLAPDESRWSLADRWIVSRFNRTVEEANKALANYRFDVYAKACYDFFWRDFCDWYVEAIKPAMKDPARSRADRATCWRRCSTARCG